MTVKPRKGSLVFLDACCLINLFATGRIEEILEVLPYRFATSELVADEEVLAIHGATAPEGSSEREIVSPRRLSKPELIEILPIASEHEQAEFVRFAANLDDGEASVCALAVVHSGAVATDDRKAIRVLDQMEPAVAVLQTPELLQEWAGSGVAEVAVREALIGVRVRGRFYPRSDSPAFAWWDSYFKDGASAT